MSPFWKGFWYGANIANWPSMIRSAVINWRQKPRAISASEPLRMIVGYMDDGDLRELVQGNRRQYAIHPENNGRLRPIYIQEP